MIKFKNKKDLQKKLLANPDIQQKIKILKELAKCKSIENPILSAGYIRDTVLGGKPRDLDICFVSPLPWPTNRMVAVKVGKKIEKKFNLPPQEWGFICIKKCKKFPNSLEVLKAANDSIASLGIDSRGTLIDATGYGVNDLKKRIFRVVPSSLEKWIQLWIINGRKPRTPPRNMLEITLRGIRLAENYNFKPAPETEDLMRLFALLWNYVPKNLRLLITTRLKKKTFNHKKVIALLKKYNLEEAIDLFKKIKV